MQYVVSDPEPDVGDGTRGTMDVTLAGSDTSGFVDLGLPDESGGMVGAIYGNCPFSITKTNGNLP